MGAIASRITRLTIIYSIIQAQVKENIKLRVTGEFPAQMASNAENVSIWWRHRVKWNQ